MTDIFKKQDRKNIKICHLNTNAGHRSQIDREISAGEKSGIKDQKQTHSEERRITVQSTG